MTIGTLKSPNPRNRNSISVIKSKFLSVSSMNTLLAILKVTDARRDVILAGGLFHRFPWRHPPPPWKIQKTAHNGLFCSLQLNPAPLRNCLRVKSQLFLSHCRLRADVVLYLTASEKENFAYRKKTKLCNEKWKKQNKTKQNKKQTNKQTKSNNNNSDYYY